jgi:hypothetical protein
MKAQIRKLITVFLIAIAMLVAAACATQTRESDKLLWEGIDDAPTNAPSTNVTTAK